MIPFEILRDAVLQILDEAFLGKPAGQEYTWVVEHDRGGLFDTLSELSAEAASFRANQDTNSIAAHSNHVLFAIESTIAEMRGQEVEGTWEETWLLQSVDAATWNTLRADLKREFEGLRTSLKGLQGAPPNDAIVGAVALPAHCHYHLGSIRQLAKMVPG